MIQISGSSRSKDSCDGFSTGLGWFSTTFGVGVNRATNIQLALDWCKKNYALIS